MNCSCRTAALRIFVRSIAESHIPAQAYRPSHVFPPQTQIRTAKTLHGTFHRSFGTTAVPRKEDRRDISFDEFGEGDSIVTPRSRQTKARKQDAPIDDSYEVADPRRKETWQVQKAVLKAKFPEGWNPRKRLSPDALEGIRALHQQFPEEYSTEILAQKFEVSPEAIRRILRSKWSPSPEEEIDRQERWFSRGKKVWERWAALGKKPPQRWRREGITRDPSWNEKSDAGQGRRSRASAQKKLSQTLL